MNLDLIELTREIMGAHSISVNVMGTFHDGAENFDGRLRKQLYKDFDYNEIIRKLEENCRDRVVYMTQDQFELNYILLKIPARLSGKRAFLVIGPFLTKEYKQILRDIMEENSLPSVQMSELKEYFCGIPYFPVLLAIETEVFILAKYIFDTVDFDIDRRSFTFAPIYNEAEIKKEDIDSFSLTVIEERYRNEEEFLQAVEHGDLKKAMSRMAAFSKFRIEPRVADTTREGRNNLIVLNTLMRKAVQRADVHPAHINSVSTIHVKQIENMRTTDELRKLINEMVSDYCRLVQNHSLSRYSRPIQKALNYIDFNYTEQLSLEMLSEVASLNASYLSTQFKKEVNISVIDYVNQKRTKRAQSLLVTTNLPVNKVSEMVGFFDDTYFARIFRKYTGKSPRDYRKTFK